VSVQHKTRQQLQHVAAIYPAGANVTMTRTQRLERWAGLLAREPDRRLSTLSRTEYQPVEARKKMRRTGSALSIAFEDPLLRAAGLSGDTYGDAKQFFELTDRELHNIVCDCHHGGSVEARAAAAPVQRAISRRAPPGWFARLWGSSNY
jgi:hypothetical protein